MAVFSGGNGAPTVVNGMVAEGGGERRDMKRERREERNGEEEDGL